MRQPVRKRLVFYCHGYDPEAETRYRRIFAIGLAHLARRFRIKRSLGPVIDDPSVPASRWTVTAGTADWQTETVYEMLRWDDLVRRDFARGWLQRVRDLTVCMAGALRDRVITNLFRLDWHFACFVIYPWILLLLAVVGAIGLGFVAAALIASSVPVAGPAKALVIGFAAIIVFAVLHPLLKQAFVYQLLHDWIFNFQHATGQRPDIDRRLDRFGERLVEAVRDSDAQEILLVGHSTGSILAVEILARALALDPELGRRGPTVVLLTIGAELPVAGYLRKAVRFRDAIVRLATSDSVLWIEYQAPQDVLNAYRFDPVRDLKLDLRGAERRNPHIRSPKFAETLFPATKRKMKWNFFRTHFQFLMPVEIPGEYDYPMIVCGPVSLVDRVSDPAAAVRLCYGEISRPGSRTGG